MVVDERLHHVFRGHGRPNDLASLDRGAAFQGQADGLFRGRLPGTVSVSRDLVLIGRHAAAAQGESLRGVLQGQVDLAGKAVLSQGVDGDRNRSCRRGR